MIKGAEEVMWSHVSISGGTSDPVSVNNSHFQVPFYLTPEEPTYYVNLVCSDGEDWLLWMGTDYREAKKEAEAGMLRNQVSECVDYIFGGRA